MKSPKDHLGQFILASARASWAPVLVFGLHVIFSRVLGAYLVFPHLDIPMHFLGGMAIIYFFTYVFAAAAAFGFLGSPNRMVLLFFPFLRHPARQSFGSSLSCSLTATWALMLCSVSTTRCPTCSLALSEHWSVWPSVGFAYPS
jgi:hypothetical protein